VHISKSPARFDPEKLAWLNQQYLKEVDDARLAVLVRPFLEADGCEVKNGPPLAAVVSLLKERVRTVEELSEAAVYFYRRLDPSEDLKREHYTAEIKSALIDLRQRLGEVEWNRGTINDAVKAVVAARKLKLPKIAMPLRVMVTGVGRTPAIDAVLELIGRDEVLERMEKQLQAFP